ncbi:MULTISPECIES: hypothetical protein [unclassified Streptomyces]|uniref:hypothetical protein n=1 Tax=unclassified Streptomyces TaxID=2593676 RepID=UPI000B8A222A|nr:MULTISPECIES: hypothetical protein [unclassified Streptomyces]MYY15353.1 hypothetical protein [Streptomyces sp. SID4912]
MTIPIWQEGTDVRQEEWAEPAQQSPGRPATVWQPVTKRPVTDLVRPREVLRPESVEEVAKGEDPDSVGKVEIYLLLRRFAHDRHARKPAA